MKSSLYGLTQRRGKMLRGGHKDWAYREGVFLTPLGKYIARVKDRRGYKTLSQHDTEDEAEEARKTFYATQDLSASSQNIKSNAVQ